MIIKKKQPKVPAFPYEKLPDNVQEAIMARLSPPDAVSLRMTSKKQNDLIERQPCLQGLWLGKKDGPLPRFPYAALQRMVLPYGGLHNAKARIAEIHKNGEVLDEQSLFQDDHLFNAAMDRWLAREVAAGTPDEDVQRAASQVRAARQSASTTLNLNHLKFQTLPPINGLKSLKTLSLSCCYLLTSLPESIGEFKALEALHLTTCCSLESLPESIGDLVALKKLYLDSCDSLLTLPERIGDLKALQELDLSDCARLRVLPESLGKLKELRELRLSNSEMILSLPGSICDLVALSELHLDGCASLMALPMRIGELSALRLLDLVACTQLVLRSSGLKLYRPGSSPTDIAALQAALPECEIETGRSNWA
jgi:Leucine-rich repeat (LRR) protein